VPVCALPKSFGKHHALYTVALPGHKPIVCACLDISPPGVVDLNPAALLALGLDADYDLSLDGAVVTPLTDPPEVAPV
jgi:hypothetical protein